MASQALPGAAFVHAHPREAGRATLATPGPTKLAARSGKLGHFRP
jgi:hypothetical protein